MAGMPALTKSHFGKKWSYEVLTAQRRYDGHHFQATTSLTELSGKFGNVCSIPNQQ